MKKFFRPFRLLGSRRQRSLNLAFITIIENLNHVGIEANVSAAKIDNPIVLEAKRWRQAIAPCSTAVPQGEVEVENDEFRLDRL